MNHDHTDHRAIPQAGSDPYDRFAADPFAPTTTGAARAGP